MQPSGNVLSDRAQGPRIRRREPAEKAVSERMATYTVQYIGRKRPTNLDAVGCGLRVLRDDEYFQYFMPIVSGSSLRAATLPHDERWWQALVASGIDRLKAGITSDFEPRAQPEQVLPITINIHHVEAYLRSNARLPELVEGQWGGHPVGTFDGP